MAWEDEEAVLRKRNLSEEDIAQAKADYFDSVVATDPHYQRLPPARQDALKGYFYNQRQVQETNPLSFKEQLIEDTVPLGAAVVSKFKEGAYNLGKTAVDALGRVSRWSPLANPEDVPVGEEAYLSDLYAKKAEEARNNPDAYRSGNRQIAGDIAVGAAGLIPDVAGMMAMGMPGYAATNAVARGGDADQVAREALKGYALQKGFEFLSPVGKAVADSIPDSLAFLKPAAEKVGSATAQAAGGAALATAEGADTGEAIRQGGTLGLLSLAGGAGTGKIRARVGGRDVLLDAPTPEIEKLTTTDRSLSTPSIPVEDRVKKKILDDAVSQGLDPLSPRWDSVDRGAGMVGDMVAAARTPAELFYSLTQGIPGKIPGMPRADAARDTIEYWKTFKGEDKSLGYFEGMPNRRVGPVAPLDLATRGMNEEPLPALPAGVVPEDPRTLSHFGPFGAAADAINSGGNPDVLARGFARSRAAVEAMRAARGEPAPALPEGRIPEDLHPISSFGILGPAADAISSGGNPNTLEPSLARARRFTDAMRVARGGEAINWNGENPTMALPAGAPPPDALPAGRPRGWPQGALQPGEALPPALPSRGVGRPVEAPAAEAPVAEPARMEPRREVAPAEMQTEAPVAEVPMAETKASKRKSTGKVYEVSLDSASGEGRRTVRTYETTYDRMSPEARRIVDGQYRPFGDSGDSNYMWEGVQQGAKKATVTEYIDPSGKISSVNVSLDPAGVVFSEIYKNPNANPSYNDAGRAVAERKAGEKKKADEERRAAQAAAAEHENRINSMRSDYRIAIDATPMPKGTRGKVSVKLGDSSIKEKEGTRYGDLFISKESDGYRVTHVPTGLAAGVWDTLGEAKKYVRAVSHSGADLSFTNPEGEPPGLLAMKQVYHWMRGGYVPDYFLDRQSEAAAKTQALADIKAQNAADGGELPADVGKNGAPVQEPVVSASALGDPALSKIFDKLPEQRRRELIGSATGVDPNSVPKAAVDSFDNAVKYSDMKGDSGKLRKPLRESAQKAIDSGGENLGVYLPFAEEVVKDTTGEKEKARPERTGIGIDLARAAALLGEQKEKKGEAVREGNYKYIPVQDGSVLIKRSGTGGEWVRHESPESMTAFISNPDNFTGLKHQANAVMKYARIAEKHWGTAAANDVYAGARMLPPELLADLPPASPTFTLDSIGDKKQIGDSAFVGQLSVIGKLGKLGKAMVFGAGRITDSKNEIAHRLLRRFEDAAKTGGVSPLTEGENLNIALSLQKQETPKTERARAVTEEMARGQEELYRALERAGAPKLAEHLQDYYTHALKPEVLQDILTNKANSKFAKEMVKETARRKGLSEEAATARVNVFIEQNLHGFERIRKGIEAGNVKKLEYAPAHKTREWVDIPIELLDTNVRERYRKYVEGMAHEIAWHENMQFFGDPADKLLRVYREGTLQRKQIIDFVKQVKGQDPQQEGVLDKLAKTVSPLRGLALTGQSPISNLLGALTTGPQIMGLRNLAKGMFLDGITGSRANRNPGVGDAGVSTQKISGTELLNFARKYHPFPRSEAALRAWLYEGSLYNLKDLASKARSDRVSMELIARYSVEPLKLVGQMEEFASGNYHGKLKAGVPEEAFYFAAAQSRAGAMAMEGWAQPRAWTTDAVLRTATTFKRFAYQKMIYDFNVVKDELVAGIKARAEGRDSDAARYYARAIKNVATSAVMHPLVGVAVNTVWKAATGQYDKSIVAKLSRIDDDSKNNIIQAGQLYVEAAMNSALGGILLSSLYDSMTAVNVRKVKTKEKPEGEVRFSLRGQGGGPENILLGFNVTKSVDMMKQTYRLLAASYGVATGAPGAGRNLAREAASTAGSSVPLTKLSGGISRALTGRGLAENIDADAQISAARKNLADAANSGDIRQLLKSSDDLREGIMRGINQSFKDGDTEKANAMVEYYTSSLDRYLAKKLDAAIQARSGK